MSGYWPKELQKIGEAAAQVEYLAQQITVLKHRSIECDARRQKAMEGLAHIRRMKKDPDYCTSDRVMVCGGPFFIEAKSGATEEFLKAEQDDLTKAMDEIRLKQKDLVKQLLELAPDQHMDQHSLQLLLKDVS